MNNRNYFIQTICLQAFLNRHRTLTGYRQDKPRVPEKNEIKTLVITTTNNKENE